MHAPSTPCNASVLRSVGQAGATYDPIVRLTTRAGTASTTTCSATSARRLLRRRDDRAQPAVVVVAVVVAALLALPACSSSPDAAASDECGSLHVEAASSLEVGSPTPDEVVVSVGSSSAMTGSKSLLALTENGQIFASTDAGSPDPGWRHAAVDTSTVDGIRACVDGQAFQALDATYTDTEHDQGDGRFCAVADAATTDISTGPAASQPKAVSAYGLHNPGCLAHPPGLIGLQDALTDLWLLVDEAGEPTAIGAAELGLRR
jgi:hypothetical protein